MGLLNPGGPIAQFKRNRCSISPVELILQSGVRKLYAARIFDNPKWVDYEAFAKHYGYQPQSYEG